MTKSISIYKGFQFRLQPTLQQEQQFVCYCGAARWVWNRMLAERNESYQITGRAPSTNAQINQLPVLKQQEDTAWLKTIHSQVLQNAVWNLDDAFQRFFKKQNGHPKFKKKHGRKQSFSYPQGVKVSACRVWLPKIGWVKFRQSRTIEGVIKQATVRRKASGWYVSLLCEVEIKPPDPVPITAENSIGMDLGSIDLVTLSDGQKVGNPRHYRRFERKLKREQRALARKQYGSKHYAQQKQRIARLHERTANRRQDDLHRLSFHLVRENQAVFAEDLNVLGIAQRMGKSTHDAAWAELLHQLEYKAAWRGKTFAQIGRFFPSSKICSCCGHKHADLQLSERNWTCLACGTLLDRDINAAVNIYREGLRLMASQHLAAGQTER